METLVTAEQPDRLQTDHEQRRSFDLTASVRLLRQDLERSGQVSPEIWQRVHDEELSYLVEGVGRASRTEFTLQRRGNQLVYFDQGDWRPYDQLLQKGVRVAQLEARQDFRRGFLASRAQWDETKGIIMRQLQPGQQHIWFSPYPHDIEAQYGAEFLRQCGFQPERKMGFIYRAYCKPDHSVVLESQTIDLSDEQALAEVAAVREYDPDMDLDTAVRVYDGVLSDKYGMQFYAGRHEAPMNAWQFLNEQADLVGFHLQRLEEIAHSDLKGQELEQAVKQQVYGVWAAIKLRLDGKRPLPLPSLNSKAAAGHDYMRVQHEVRQAFQEALKDGFRLSGCGGAISFETAMEATPQDVFDGIFGSKSTEEIYSFDKKMYCRVCQAPPAKNEPKKMCGPCAICRDCDRKLGGKG